MNKKRLKATTWIGWTFTIGFGLGLLGCILTMLGGEKQSVVTLAVSLAGLLVGLFSLGSATRIRATTRMHKDIR